MCEQLRSFVHVSSSRLVAVASGKKGRGIPLCPQHKESARIVLCGSQCCLLSPSLRLFTGALCVCTEPLYVGDVRAIAHTSIHCALCDHAERHETLAAARRAFCDYTRDVAAPWRFLAPASATEIVRASGRTRTRMALSLCELTHSVLHTASVL